MTATKRTRLSPHDRRMQLLDSALVTIQSHGLSSFTMEALAREAGVSNPLVYKYFDTRLDLLQELLSRETDQFNERLKEEILTSDGFEDLVRVVVSVNFEQFSSGNILNILRDSPDVVSSVSKADREKNNEMGQFLIKSMADEYALSWRQATHVVVLASGASQALAAHHNRSGGDKAAMIEEALGFIFGGIKALVP